jgi:hypothetical protein
MLKNKCKYDFEILKILRGKIIESEGIKIYLFFKVKAYTWADLTAKRYYRNVA